MRLHRALVPAIASVMMLLLTQAPRAQLYQCIEGIDYTVFNQDTARIVSFQGLPGDTVEMAVYFKADSVVLAMTMNLRYPGSLLRPVVFPDSTIDTTINNLVLPPDTTIDTVVVEFLDIRETGRAFFPIVLQDSLGFDYNSNKDLFRSTSIKVRDSSILKIQWLAKIPSISNPLDSLPGGAGEIVRVKFIVESTTFPEGTALSVTLDHVPVLDTTIFPPVQVGCALTATAQNWVVTFDTTTEVLSLLQVPVLAQGFFKLDSATGLPECTGDGDCPPQTGYTVQCVSNTCIYTLIDTTSCSVDSDCPAISGFTVACDGSGNCVYTPITGSHAPVVNPISPSAVTVTQGELVTFTVTATDDSATHTITLNGNMPTGATLSSAPGNSPVTGVFTWTPGLTQAGTFVVSFTATDNTGKTSPSVSVTITVEELSIDQLFSTSSVDMAPVGGIPGFNPVLFPIDLLSRQDSVYGIQFDMLYPHRQIEIDSIITTDRTPTFVVDWLAMNDSLIRVVTLGLDNEAIVAGTTSAVLQIALHVDTSAAPGTYPVILFNGRESIDPNPAIGSLELLTFSGVIEVDQVGDVNLDKFIDVADMVNIVAYIIGNFGLPPRNFATADVTVDDIVNVVDLVGISNLIFGLPLGPSPVAPGPATLASLTLDEAEIEIGGYGSVSLAGEFPEDVAGVEFHLDYNPSSISLMAPELTDASRKFRLHYKDDHKGEMRVVIYSSSPWNSETLIPEGVSDILSIPMLASENAKASDITISNIALSNAQADKIETEIVDPEPVQPETFYLAQNYPNPFNPSTQIDFSINVDTDGAKLRDVTLDIFNILGQRVITLVDEAMTPGEYSVTWAGNDNHGKKVATGVYFYRLRIGESEQATKKMLLLK